ncbi:hypothetical protein ABIC63_003416 [Pseudacidovorax sp. 1753]|uniref:excalibur calcium-binding domain-containing protein n=1 Tax=Pseudacidovorax sp. 1753 TaxID=3156419 RepID=UPI0033987ECC
MFRLVLLVVLGLAAWKGYEHYQGKRTATTVAPAPELAVQAPSQPAQLFRCDGRKYCSQMTSCAEATYFLKNCPDVKMDGNGDGVPCEQQWCRP